ncbi:PucR family transcriptional regulator [Amycolatopsis balhimycina DSM 5908]|uniref:PucR family transcriptional regulator n=1 Tax=Amycolatopsis balhimycina DSM 5908 TaxID=1081091 RepID=A0A428X1C2_AMYBA|nr:helix-turn-helix domain-containing protein [Amycolatopsis balhimycina]RSM49086.1 PucR family transcriptional regulator [Amycolatopsis balhimycina DSM 5908]
MTRTITQAAVPHPRGTGRARQLWCSLPTELAPRFRPHADQLARRILEEIQRAVPEYAKPLEGEFGRMIVLAIEQAVLSCIDSIEELASTQDNWAKLFVEVGKRVHHDGGSLNSLQAAYRAGGRAAWRYIAELGQAHRFPAAVLCVGAEAIFAYVEEISSYSVEGYTLAQAMATGTLDRRRRRLFELLLAGPPSSPATLATMAKAAQWTMPEWVTVVALDPRTEQQPPPSPQVADDVLVDVDGPEPCLLTPNPDRDLRGLEGRLPGWRAAVGPRVHPADAATSLLWARRTLDLVRRGLAGDDPVTHTADHLATHWLLADRFLLDELSAKVLAPFETLTVKQQTRLSETLLSWLEHNGNTPDIAQALGIHPQTVRYRVSQLTDLFGDRLADPAKRLEIQMALRAHRLLGTRPPAGER